MYTKNKNKIHSSHQKQKIKIKKKHGKILYKRKLQMQVLLLTLQSSTGYKVLKNIYINKFKSLSLKEIKRDKLLRF